MAMDVYDLTRWGQKLDEEELAELPFKHCYNGKEVLYRTERREAFELLMRIVKNANKMQDPEFYSFILGML